MTQIDEIEVKCSVCGKSSPQYVLLSTNSFGYPDLDTRPPEMQRSTMDTWVQECKHCGYVADDIEEDRNITPEFLKSNEYMSCSGYEFEHELAKRFYKNYLISKQLEDLEGEFFNILHCA